LKEDKVCVSISLLIVQGVNDLVFFRLGSTLLDLMLLKRHPELISEVLRLLLISFKYTKLLPGYIYKTNGWLFSSQRKWQISEFTSMYFMGSYQLV